MDERADAEEGMPSAALAPPSREPSGLQERTDADAGEGAHPALAVPCASPLTAARDHARRTSCHQALAAPARNVNTSCPSSARASPPLASQYSAPHVRISPLVLPRTAPHPFSIPPPLVHYRLTARVCAQTRQDSVPEPHVDAVGYTALRRVGRCRSKGCPG
ncbi:hypothetical protein DFH09DRAFT_1196044 [Mycena vulgaris]|nr:hypothetical protein DFH09DRAFT_1196044 [Mycena vulgaris]